MDDSTKANKSLSSGRRVALIAFVAVAALVCSAFIAIFWLSIFLVDDPIPWILGLVVVGGVLGIAQATVLWSFIVDLCVWSIDNQPMHRIRSQFPAVESIISVAPRFALPLRGIIALQSTIQIVGAGIFLFFM